VKESLNEFEKKIPKNVKESVKMNLQHNEKDK